MKICPVCRERRIGDTARTCLNCRRMSGATAAKLESLARGLGNIRSDARLLASISDRPEKYVHIAHAIGEAQVVVLSYIRAVPTLAKAG